MADRTLTINHADGDSETYTIKRDKFAGVREMSVDGSTVTVDRTAKPKAQSKETTFGVSGQKALDGKREQVNLYGISGQSNGAGRAENGDAGTRFDALDALSSQAFIYNRGTGSFDQFDFGINQTLTGGNSGNFGPESELLRLAVDGVDTKSFVVKYTAGGTNLYAQWDSEAGGNLYSTFVADYQAAVSSLQAQGYDVIHKGVLFAQGERDSKNDLGGGVISYYEDKQLKFVENLRKDLNIPSLPVSLTLITVLGTLESTYTHISEVNQAKQNVADTLEHVRVIDSSSFGFKDDNLHYDGDGQVAHGSAFYSQAVGSFSFQYITIKREIEPLLNKVVGGASAAYSLRDLNDKAGNNKVVRVRRSSDNAEADFKASEVSDGALTDWVNAASTNGTFANTGYESFSGASASGFTASNSSSTGFAVSDIPDGVSGDIVKVSFDITVTSGSPGVSLRGALNGTGTSSSSDVSGGSITSSGSYTVTLTATSNYVGIGFVEGDSPSEFTVSNFKIVADGFVETWYDQSGNDNDAVQLTAGSQPKIVDAGALVSGGIELDGVDDYLGFTNNITLTDADIYSVLSTSDTLFSIFGTFISNSNKVFLPLAQQNSTSTELYKNVTINEFYLNGSLSSPATRHASNALIATGSNVLANFNGASTSFYLAELGRGGGAATWAIDGSISEIIIYPSDQSANRPAIEANINNQYDIY